MTWPLFLLMPANTKSLTIFPYGHHGLSVFGLGLEDPQHNSHIAFAIPDDDLDLPLQKNKLAGIGYLYIVLSD